MKACPACGELARFVIRGVCQSCGHEVEKPLYCGDKVVSL